MAVICSSDPLYFLLSSSGLIMKIIKAHTCRISTQWLCEITREGIIVDITWVKSRSSGLPSVTELERNGCSNPSLSGCKFWALFLWIKAFAPGGCSLSSTSEPWLKVYISLQTLLNCEREANVNCSDVGWNVFSESRSLVSKWKDYHKAAENHLTQRRKKSFDVKGVRSHLSHLPTGPLSWDACPDLSLCVCLTENCVSSFPFLSSSTLLPSFRLTLS